MVLRAAGSAVGTVLATLISAVVALSLLIIVLVARGPLSLTFLTPFAHQIFAEAGFPGRVEITDTVFSWEGSQGRLDVRFIGVRIYDDKGRRRAEIPKLAVALDGWALLRGSLAPSHIELIEPSLHLTRSRTGQIGLGLGQNSQTGFNLLSLR